MRADRRRRPRGALGTAGPVAEALPDRTIQRDAAALAPWAELLFEQGVEVIHPVFEGDEAEIREYHEENLRTVRRRADFLRRGQRVLAAPQAAGDAEGAGYGRTEAARRSSAFA